MREVLIINTRRLGDIYSMVPLLVAQKAQNPICRITVLTYTESQKACAHLNCIDTVVALDRQHFVTLKKSNIYNKAFSLEFLYESLKPVLEKKWDMVINYSNDQFSTYLTSFLSEATNFCGLKYDLDSATLVSSGNFTLALNELAASSAYSFMPNVDYFLNELTLTNYNNEYNVFLTSPNLDKQANLSFIKIKELEKESGRDISIVGIQFKTSKEDKDIPLSLLTQIINEILDNENFYPVIISAPTEEEREITKKINSYFNNSLIIIESDLFGLPSILNNLDYLICPDTAVKHMADLCNLPTVELSFGASPLFKQGSRNKKSIILSDNVWTRNYGKETDEKTRATSITAKNVIAALEIISNKNVDLAKASATTANFIRPVNTDYGVTYKILFGPRDPHKEISLAFVRKFCIESFCNGNLQIDLDEYTESEIANWVKEQMANLGLLLKDILNTLRTLKQNDNGFIKSLDSLLTRPSEFMISNIAVQIFKFKLENMTNEGVAVNQTKIEAELYNLKNRIQSAVNMLKDVASKNKIYGASYEESRIDQ